MSEHDGRSVFVGTRIPSETHASAVKLAERLYDGNTAMLVRIAVKRFVAEQEAAVAGQDGTGIGVIVGERELVAS